LSVDVAVWSAEQVERDFESWTELALEMGLHCPTTKLSGALVCVGENRVCCHCHGIE
jgi:hypothetical protein